MSMLSDVFIGAIGLIGGVDAHHSHSHGKDGHFHSHGNGGHFHSQYTQLVQAAFPFGARYNSVLASVYLGLLPCLLVMVLPGFQRGGTRMVRMMVPFAMGGILGDVLLHVVPELYGHGEESDLRVGYGIFGGIVAFMVMDKMMRVLGGDSHGHGHGHGHSHSHSHASENEKEKKEEKTSLRASTYLNMVSESIHKAMDGLTLASSFYASKHAGSMTFIALALHEVPHELGDFAVKMSSGMSFGQAVRSEMVTCLGSLAGIAIGCMLNEAGGAGTASASASASASGTGSATGAWSSLVSAMSCGGFIYTSTVGVIPELLGEAGGPDQAGVLETVVQIACAFLGFHVAASMH
ncbi:zinc transporter YKE4 [Kluyveromyces marxianus]|uniref:Zinc transporter YKE4 n=1 Tax=Kluyveromyces marxianus (strain DMKU3-1042 / BCC 29191 / NBRC 104275) TaxID=1003335 RepID=W0TAP9_KLUMD|nr:zinc transporter YKE4 [Kluyveromyces marxianus DMKU3-1042]BAO40113.1 zinc transporter YKE4 [Kluyveromyces marxianus DMKU3-1042]BAP71603.1 zinc transporter YKE4 [Kluyveromyces marxianus]